jgi:hypothetical protein
LVLTFGAYLPGFILRAQAKGRPLSTDSEERRFVVSSLKDAMATNGDALKGFWFGYALGAQLETLEGAAQLRDWVVWQEGGVDWWAHAWLPLVAAACSSKLDVSRLEEVQPASGRRREVELKDGGRRYSQLAGAAPATPKPQSPPTTAAAAALVARLEATRAELRALYGKYVYEKTASEVEDILKHFSGREDELLGKVKAKYLGGNKGKGGSASRPGSSSTWTSIE